ncbi:hypothetical protein [Crocinitomix catalasitica]|uniref:hypothetical protein n=1 Tax=Crocinitomix catalasitica TaxID=184607 RepID=UPI0012F744AE|nr:hypothetical protein [Crocinitomix catalasitica]
MNKNFLRTTQFFVLLNLISHIFWFTGMIEGFLFRLFFEQMELVIIIVGLIFLISSLFIGMYFFLNQFRFTLFAFALNVLGYLVIFLIYWQIVNKKVDYFEALAELQFIVMLISLLYGVSILISKARTKKWLKRIGFFMVVYSISIIVIELITIEADPVFNFIRMIVTYSWCLVPIAYLLNFKEEIKVLFPVSNNDVLDG